METSAMSKGSPSINRGWLTIASLLLALALGTGSTLAADGEAPVDSFGPEDVELLTEMSIEAYGHFERGELARALEIQEQVLEARTRILGPEHPDTLLAMNDLALTSSEQGDLARALELQEQVLEARIRVLGPDDPDTIGARSNLAITVFRLGDHSSARPMFEQVLDDRIRVLGPEHPDTVAAMRSLAFVLANLGSLPVAQDLLAAVPSTVGPVTLEIESQAGPEIVGQEPERWISLLLRSGKMLGDLSQATGLGSNADDSVVVLINALRIDGVSARDWAAEAGMDFPLYDPPLGVYPAWRDIDGRRVSVVSYNGDPDTWFAVYPIGETLFVIGGRGITVEEVIAELPAPISKDAPDVTSDADQFITMMVAIALYESWPFENVVLNLSMSTDAWDRERMAQLRDAFTRTLVRLDALDVRDCFAESHMLLRAGTETLRAGLDLILDGQDDAGKSLFGEGLGPLSDGREAAQTAAGPCAYDGPLPTGRVG